MNDERSKKIVKTSIIGIGANVLLAAFKAVMGVLSGSIAVTMDAVNNLSDAMSSLITIIGTKLSEKPADRKHPFGYGRVEYLSALLISLIVAYAGITSLVESVKKIFDPVKPEYSTVTLILLAVGVAVKVLLGQYVKGVGKKVDSDSLVNSGQDALMDAVISFSTFVAALIYLWKQIPLEAYLGTIISVLIIRSGLEMIGDTVSRILGEAGDIRLASAIKKTVTAHKEVKGVYDVVLQDHGPDRYTASLHIEVEDTLSADELDDLSRQITKEVYLAHNVALTAIGVYSVNTKDPEVIRIRKEVSDLVRRHEEVVQMHGFNIDTDKKEMRLDIVVSLDSKNRDQVYHVILDELKEKYPDHSFMVTMDTDFLEAL